MDNSTSKKMLIGTAIIVVIVIVYIVLYYTAKKDKKDNTKKETPSSKSIFSSIFGGDEDTAEKTPEQTLDDDKKEDAAVVPTAAFHSISLARPSGSFKVNEITLEDAAGVKIPIEAAKLSLVQSASADHSRTFQDGDDATFFEFKSDAGMRKWEFALEKENADVNVIEISGDGLEGVIVQVLDKGGKSIIPDLTVAAADTKLVKLNLQPAPPTHPEAKATTSSSKAKVDAPSTPDYCDMLVKKKEGYDNGKLSNELTTALKLGTCSDSKMIAEMKPVFALLDKLEKTKIQISKVYSYTKVAFIKLPLAEMKFTATVGDITNDFFIPINQLNKLTKDAKPKIAVETLVKDVNLDIAAEKKKMIARVHGRNEYKHASKYGKAYIDAELNRLFTPRTTV